MSLESFNYIDSLNAANPTTTDNVSEGDDHIRGIKTTLKNTFPNINAAVTATDEELNYVDGVTSAIQTQIDTKLPLAGGTMTGDIAFADGEGISLGAGNDLSLFSDGSTVKVKGDDIRFLSADNTETYFNLSKNAGIGLRYDNSTKLATTNTGVDITGKITASTYLEADTDITDPGVGSAVFYKKTGVGGVLSSYTLGFDTGGLGARQERMRIDSSGNVGVGTSSPSALLEIAPAAVDTSIFAIRREDHASIKLFDFFQDSNIAQGTGGAHINTENRDLAITTDTYSTLGNGLYIATSGNVGIGTSSPDYKLDVHNSSAGNGTGIAAFRGSDVSQRFLIMNLLCGSDEDRVGILWENQGTLNQRMWCDDTGDIRVSGSNPTADNSGTVVGTQTFTGTHIYKSNDDTLITGEAVKLVDRKLVRCTEAKDPTCIGIFIGKSDKLVDSFEDPCTYDYWHDVILYTDEDVLSEGVEVGDVKTEGYSETKNPDAGYPYAIASLGDTIANVSGTKLEGVLVDCEVSAGDLLCTSANGLLTKQDDDIIHSYTVAKAGEDGDSTASVYAYVYCG